MYEKKLAASLAQQLRELINPYFLRRQKKEVFKNDIQKNNKSTTSPVPDSRSRKSMTPPKVGLSCRKNDLVVWIGITKPQLNLYSNFLLTPFIQTVCAVGVVSHIAGA